MNAALTLHLTIRPLSEYLLIAAGGLVVLGPVLAAVTGSRLEIGAVALWSVTWVLAAVVLLVAIGSLL